MALHDFYDLSERKRIARGEFNSTQVQLRELLEETGARRVEVECAGVGLHQSIRPWLVEDGGRRLVDVDEACPSAESLREWQALPGRGAWFRSRLWMDAEEKVLHQESDWMGEPVFDPDGEPDLYHYWAELDYFPRDEELVPHWLRRRLERWEAERAPAFNGRIAELEAEKAAIMAASNELAAQVTSLQQEVENLRAERGDLDEIREEYERRYDEIKELSQFLPRIKEDQEARARREADVLISDARNKAQEIQVSALAERDRIDEDISRLEAARNELLVSTQKTLLVHERALARFREKIGPLDAGE